VETGLVSSSRTLYSELSTTKRGDITPASPCGLHKGATNRVAAGMSWC
jgi:hypothetical protein